MNDVSDLYLLWVKAARMSAQSDLHMRSKAFESLQNKDSTYGRSIAAMRDASEKVLAIWMAMPDELVAPTKGEKT